MDLSVTYSESRPRLRPQAVLIGVIVELAGFYAIVLLIASLSWTGKKPQSSFDVLQNKDPVSRSGCCGCPIKPRSFRGYDRLGEHVRTWSDVSVAFRGAIGARPRRSDFSRPRGWAGSSGQTRRLSLRVGHRGLSRSTNMDPVIRVRDFLIDNIGHMTYPGNASFDSATQRWFVPVCCRTERGDLVVGDVELDRDGHLVFAPSREEMLARLGATASRTS